jgi:hypothetical protein
MTLQGKIVKGCGAASNPNDPFSLPKLLPIIEREYDELCGAHRGTINVDVGRDIVVLNLFACCLNVHSERIRKPGFINRTVIIGDVGTNTPSLKCWSAKRCRILFLEGNAGFIF